jgi:hypothetical protein
VWTCKKKKNKMSTDPVTKILGIGKVISETLRSQGITTIGQLALLEADTVSIPNIETLIRRARDYVGMTKTKEETRTLTKDIKEIQDIEDGKENTTNSEQREKFLIADHSWYECKVVIPSGESLREAIVYELCVEPHDRIVCVCSWITSESSEEHMHTMTFSPQLLVHFNLLELPPLRVSIREEDFQALPNRHVLSNILSEVEIIQHKMAL